MVSQFEGKDVNNHRGDISTATSERWYKDDWRQNKAVAQGLWTSTPSPDSDCELMFCLSTAALTAASKMSPTLSTALMSLWAESLLGNLDPIVQNA